MQPATPASQQAAQTPAPVFVDDTGRRHRFVRLVGWVVGGLTLAYLALLGVSLIGSPGLIPLSLPAIGRVLPGPSAPHLGDVTRVTRDPLELAPGDPRTTTSGGAVGSTSTGGPGVGGVQPSAPAPRPTPSASSPKPTPSATAGRTPQGNPSPAGTPRPSRSPSPHSTRSSHGTPHNVRATATPSPT